jgi:excisionase family DNA binding protein
MQTKNKRHQSPPEAANSEILTKDDLSLMINCTGRFIEKQVSAGHLRCCKLSRKLVRFRRRDVEAWLESRASVAA